MPYGRHIYATSDDMTMATVCAYPKSQYTLPRWKFVLRCYYNCPHIYHTDQELDRHHSNASSSICFHIYHLISQCTVHGRRPPDENKICLLCFQDVSTVTHEKLFTRKYLVMMDTYIDDSTQFPIF